jgi:hypothetical protein
VKVRGVTLIGWFRLSVGLRGVECLWLSFSSLVGDRV